MGQIIGGAAKPKRCNLNQLSQLGTPAAGEHILVSSDNSMNAAGQGNFDCYIVGNGQDAATALELKEIDKDIYDIIGDSTKISNKELIDYYAITPINFYPHANGTWIIYYSWKSIITPLPIGCKRLEIVAANNPVYFFLLNSGTYPTENRESANLASGETGRRVIPAGTSEVITLPSDCTHIGMGVYANNAWNAITLYSITDKTISEEIEESKISSIAFNTETISEDDIVWTMEKGLRANRLNEDFGYLKASEILKTSNFVPIPYGKLTFTLPNYNGTINFGTMFYDEEGDTLSFICPNKGAYGVGTVSFLNKKYTKARFVWFNDTTTYGHFSLSIISNGLEKYVSVYNQSFAVEEQQQIKENIGIGSIDEQIFLSLTENKSLVLTPMFVKQKLYAHGEVKDKVTITTHNDANTKIFFYPCKAGEPFVVKYALTEAGVGLNSIDVLFTESFPNNGVIADVLFTDNSSIPKNTEQTINLYAPKDGYVCVRCYMAYYNYIRYYRWQSNEADNTFVSEIYNIPFEADSAGINADSESNNYGGVTSVATSNLKYSDYIDISDTKYLKLYCVHSSSGIFNKTDIFGSVFYDANKVPIVNAADTHQYCASGYAQNCYVIVKVPDNAKYIRITQFSTVSTTIAFWKYREKLSDAITDIAENVSNDSTKKYISQAKFVSSSPTTQALGILHFSDIHGDNVSVEKILKALNEYEVYINDVVCTGDSVYYYAEDTSLDNTWWRNSGLAEKSLFVLGNHDSATQAGTEYDQQEDSGAWDGKGKNWCFDTYFSPYINQLGYIMPTGYNDPSSINYKACYWHKDYPSQKLRVIGLDCLHRFDGILNPETGSIISQGLKWTTNEQELWLIDKLNETLDSNNSAYEYSVVFVCHYPLDDFSGNNEQWDDSSHKFVYNHNNNGGRIMSYKKNAPSAFHYENTTSYIAERKFNMRNRVDNGYSQGADYPNYNKGEVNNIGNIISNWIDNGGKYVVWICGHTHVDFMWYPTNYPNMLCVVIDQAGCLRGTNTGDRNSSLDSRVCANYYSFDTQNGLMKIVRIGYTQNRLMNKHEYLCYDYINRIILNEG